MAELQPLLPRKIMPLPPIGDAPALPDISGMGGGIPASVLAPPMAPNVAADPRTSLSTGDPLEVRKSQDQADLYRRMNPIAPTTTLGKIGHVAAGIGNVLGNIFAPGVTALIPGSGLNNELQKNRDRSDIDEVSGLQTAAAGRAQTEANTAYALQRPQIEQDKIMQKLTSSLGKAGLVPVRDENGQLTGETEDDSNSPASQSRHIHDDVEQSKQALQDAETQVKLASNDPNSPTYKLAITRAQIARTNANAAVTRAQAYYGNYLQHAFNKDLNGNVLAGAPEITDDNGNTTVVGSTNAGNAIKQQNSVGSFNDLSGSIDHTESALKDYFAEGGSLTDPTVISALNDHTTPMAQWIGGLVQSGLSPKAIAAVTALRQNHEQAGILRKATGGTASEAGAQRILETAPMAGDTNDVALSKIAEQKNVRDRLAPGMTGVAGGVQVSGKKGSAPASKGTIRAVDPQGVLHEAPAGTPLPKGWKAQ